MKKSNIFKMLALSLAMFVATPEGIQNVDAKSKSSSSRSSSSWGSKSSKSSSSKSWGSKSTKPKTTAPKTSTSSKSSSWNKKATTSSSKTKSAPKLTPAQQKAKLNYDKAKASGKAFPTRKAAVEDFKTKNASKYTSKYASKPATRPTHIPETTQVGGNTYNVKYNQSHGGYGYMDALGTFILYDMFTDQIALNAAMSQQGYYHGEPPIRTTVVHTNNGLSFVLIIGGLLIFGIIIFVFLRNH